jgi:DNA-binding MarR family transcriptional regulator
MRAMDPELERAAADAFGWMFVVAGHLTRLADARLADWDLTTRQWLLLAVLTQAFPGRAPSLSDAAAAYGSSRQNVKQIAIGLESRGFLRLVPDGSDGRMTRLVLTDRIRLFDEPEGVARGRDLLASAFAGLSRDDVLTLRALLGRWRDALGRTDPPTRAPAGASDAATTAPRRRG